MDYRSNNKVATVHAILSALIGMLILRLDESRPMHRWALNGKYYESLMKSQKNDINGSVKIKSHSLYDISISWMYPNP